MVEMVDKMDDKMMDNMVNNIMDTMVGKLLSLRATWLMTKQTQKTV